MKFGKVAQHIGIVVDTHYKKKVWVHELIQSVPPGGVVVTATGGAHVFIEGTVRNRGDLHYELFVEDDWHKKKYATRLRDWQMVSYLKFTHGTLYLFPQAYDRNYGKHFSDRLQDLIIVAHQTAVNYKVIVGDE